MSQSNLNYRDIKKLSDDSYFKSLSIEDLKKYSELIRSYLIDICCQHTSHLASNLGVVELTLALKKVFDFKKDSILFDVGHQVYTYKLLTDRFDKFQYLREKNGMSGFPDPDESPYDIFRTGHVGSALPLALGLAHANGSRRLKEIVTIIGDGALTNGATLEALNFIENYKMHKMIIILNDNGMSISKTQSAISKKLSTFATQLDIRGKLQFLVKIKLFSPKFFSFLEKSIAGIKNIVAPSKIIEDYGIRYVGPIDGHCIKTLIYYFNLAKRFDKTILLHVITKKGKGYIPAECNPEVFHSSGKFDKETGKFTEEKKLTFTNYFGKKCMEIGSAVKPYIITAAMKKGCGLDEFGASYPELLIDVGIAESLAVSLGGSLVKAGNKSIVAIYSTFIQRAADQLYHDVALNRLPVMFAVDRHGIVGVDGPTHHGLYIHQYVQSIPESETAFVGFEEDFDWIFNYFKKGISKPLFMFYPKDTIYSIKNASQLYSFIDYQKVKAIYENSYPALVNLSEGEFIALICVGSLSYRGIKIKEKALKKHFNPSLYHVCFTKPLDEGMLDEIAAAYSHIIVVEESPEYSYFISLLSNCIAKNNHSVQLHTFLLPDKFIPQGSRDELLGEYLVSDNAILDLMASLKRINAK